MNDPTTPAERDAAYDKIDRFLRNNLGDADYANYSEALELVYAAPAPQGDDAQDAARYRWLRDQSDPDLRAHYDAGIDAARAAAMTESHRPAAPAPSDLHQQIMNLPVGTPGWAGNDLLLYKEGHRDARHAAAELVAASGVSAPNDKEPK